MTGEANSNLIYFDGLLKLRYVHGDQCHNGKIRETQITFLCDEKAGVGHPQFEQEITCGIYNFLWYTEFACHSKVYSFANVETILAFAKNTLPRVNVNSSYQPI